MATLAVMTTVEVANAPARARKSGAILRADRIMRNLPRGNGDDHGAEAA
jgi:hypothetical protein